MFEAVVTLCLETGTPCRDVLVPGYEAGTAAACAERLSARPPEDGAAAFCAPTGPALEVEEAAPGVFVHRGAVAEPDAENAGDVSNLGFVVGETAVAVIDTGGSRIVGEAAWRAIRARTDLPVTHAILTHMHPDHVFGAGVFAEAGAEIVGHSNLGRALADRVANYRESFEALIGVEVFLGSSVAVPTAAVAVDTAHEIDLGGRVLDLRAWPTAHTPTDLTVMDPVTGTLFAGDLVFSEHAPALDGSLRGWIAVLDILSGEPFARVVPGHGGPVLDWPDGGAPLGRYLAVLAAETRYAIDAGMRIGEAAETVAEGEAENWALFDVYNPRNATAAFTELEWE